jgi:hypothetical protein
MKVIEVFQNRKIVEIMKPIEVEEEDLEEHASSMEHKVI